VTVALAHLQPAQIARESIAHHSKSFALASRLLGPRLRDETAILYTWCRRADDAIDNARTPHEGREELLRLHRELDAVYLSTTREPVLAAFADVVKARKIPRRYPAELLAGMGMDVAATHYATIEDLIGYAYRVAGVVGLMMTHVFGVRDDDALVHAAHLGIAMQLTNVCRDVAEDWERGRLYIPDEVLSRHGAAGLATMLGAPLPAAARASVAAAVEELLELADRYYASGVRGEHSLPWRAAIAVRSARGVYSAIGARIGEANHDVMAGRAVVSGSTKLARVASAFARTAIELPGRMFSRRPAVPTLTLGGGDVPRL
jgi:15-cis-phytoene synthase